MILTEYDEKKHLSNIREEGRKQGIEEGREEGMEKLNSLYAILLESNRMDDVVKATKDKQYREQLFKEFNL